MKKIIFIVTIIFYGCTNIKTTKIDDTSLLKKENDSLKVEIIQLKEEVKLLKDELQFKESEISYWGHKYDSLKIKN